MRTPRATVVRRTATVALCALVLLLGSCGGGPTPRMWAASVCEALAPWRAEISNLTSSTRQQMTAKTTPAQAKENLVRLLGGAERASDAAREKIADAGVPDVAGGEAVVDGFLASLGAVRDAYGRARRAVESLDTAEPKVFYDGVQAAIETLQKEYRASALDTSRLDSPELKQAFDEVPECR